MDKDPMDGNSKIPRIIFADQQERLRRSLPYLKIDRLDYFGCISYVLTGGFQRVGFPVGLIKSAIKAEKFLSQSTLRRIALRVLIVLHKTA